MRLYFVFEVRIECYTINTIKHFYSFFAKVIEEEYKEYKDSLILLTGVRAVLPNS